MDGVTEPGWVQTTSTGSADPVAHPWGPFPAFWNAYSTSTSVFTLYATYEVPPQYLLTIMATADGTTNPAPGEYSYVQGSVVSVTALANYGYVLGQWELDGNVVTPHPGDTINVVMDGNHTLRAVFVALPTHTLSVSTSPITGVTFSIT